MLLTHFHESITVTSGMEQSEYMNEYQRRPAAQQAAPRPVPRPPQSAPPGRGQAASSFHPPPPRNQPSWGLENMSQGRMQSRPFVTTINAYPGNAQQLPQYNEGMDSEVCSHDLICYMGIFISSLSSYMKSKRSFQPSVEIASLFSGSRVLFPSSRDAAAHVPS